MNPPDSTDAKDAPPTLEPPKTNWPLFFILQLAPMVISMLAKGPKSSPTDAYFLFGSAAVAGILCGLMMSRRMAGSDLSRGFCFLLFAPVFGVTSLCLSIVGCCAVNGAPKS